MRAIIQRVSRASVSVREEHYKASIDAGLLILLGIEDADTEDDVNWLIRKITNMRIFSDEAGKMNLSILDIGGKALIISQFTLHASTKKGNRPSFIRSARPEQAIPLYNLFVSLIKEVGVATESGIFGAHMEVELINNGPVTIYIDSKNKE